MYVCKKKMREKEWKRKKEEKKGRGGRFGGWRKGELVLYLTFFVASFLYFSQASLMVLKENNLLTHFLLTYSGLGIRSKEKQDKKKQNKKEWFL